jgi:ubiquinone/menaquinone biosynthesis C-methylase UbiE
MSGPDFTAITQRQQATWALGDFNVLALAVMEVADALVQVADPRPGARVLDVACGSGNAALAAARRYAQVSGIDYVPGLIERARQRAAADGVNVDFQVADAQALPFPDGHFDTVLSVFGVMFAPDQERAAAEILRVTRPGGTIALSSWSPEGFGGDLFRAHAKFAPPPAGVKPGVRWGTDQGLAELFGDQARATRAAPQIFHQHYLSVEHALEVFRTYFGPSIRAYETVGAAGEAALSAALLDVFRRYNRATDGTASLECQYMQAIITRR